MQLEQRTNDIVSQTRLDSQAESPLGIESALCLKCCLLKTGLTPRPHPFTRKNPLVNQVKILGLCTL